MGKKSKEKVVEEVASQSEGECEQSQKQYESPLAVPLLDGKTLQRSLKLLKAAVNHERLLRSSRKPAEEGEFKKAKSFKRPVKRGVAEVTKCVRKGEKGVVFLASDVFPHEIIAHLPVLCEEREVMYAYIGSKKTLGAACRSKRPSSVLMVAKPTEDGPQSEYKKALAGIKKVHPYF